MNRVLGLSAQTGGRLAEVALLLVLFAGVWLVATYWGHFG